MYKIPMHNKRVVYLKKDIQEHFNRKRSWYVNAYRIVDENGKDLIQPWCDSKKEARDVCIYKNWELNETQML